MDSLAAYKHKIISSDANLKRLLAVWQLKGERIVFTNGCFDILHIGHLHTLSSAKQLGSKLIVGLNSDDSIKRLKGIDRPKFNQKVRLRQLSTLIFVDAIILFTEDTPLNLIKKIKPNTLVKGGDYEAEEVVGSTILKSYGGQVKIIPYLKGFSTTSILVNG